VTDVVVTVPAAPPEVVEPGSAEEEAPEVVVVE
jgi:hypothetical protein